jgi:acetyl-CoA acetyltransferase
MIGRLSGKYAIVGVGETPYRRYAQGEAPPAIDLATEAVSAALADAGLSPLDVDCLMSYHLSDSAETASVAGTMGMNLNNFVDITGGGSSIETLIALAIGLLEGGSCTTVAIYRSMHGYSGNRIGLGGGNPTMSNGLLQSYGVVSAAQRFAPVFARYLAEGGATSEQVAHVKVAHSRHASANPKALYKVPVTVGDVLSSRWIVDPILHLLDCCVESDSATAVIVTSIERARDLKQHPVQILGALGRMSRGNPDYFYGGDMTALGATRARDIIFPMAGIKPDDVDVTGAYDAFTFVSTLVLEKFGFCEPGAGGVYVSDGTIELGGRRPNNTSGGQLCEGYTHGVNLVIENVRQLRWTADDYCPGADRAVHSFNYAPGNCRQVHEPKIAMNMGWRSPGSQTALVLARD